ncbi:MAG: leucine-rich repeat protein [Clostridiales Family XIII bacterium]|jgi:hypothetical protein|nr:leucine-rich repeat protein [Clostridiales Family XIII bacterium]
MSNTRFLPKAAALLFAACLVFALCAQTNAGAWASEEGSAPAEAAPEQGGIEPLSSGEAVLDGIHYWLEYNDEDEGNEAPGTAKITGYDGGAPVIDIPDEISAEGRAYTITEIADRAFAGSGVKEVHLENSTMLAKVGSGAFADCASLESLTLATRIWDVGEKILEGASQGAQVYVLDAQGAYANAPASWNPQWLEGFSGSVNGKSVDAPQPADFSYSVKGDGTIKLERYEGANTDIVIPSEIEGKAVTELGGYLFIWVDDAFTGSITVPDSVQTVAAGAFSGTSGDIYVAFEADALPAGWDPDWASGAGGNFYFNGEQVTALLNYSLNADGLGYTVTGVSNNPEEVAIPAVHKGLPVTAIGANAFQYKSALAQVAIPSSVTAIGRHAFSYSGLESLDIPASVESIGASAFFYCKSLTQVTGGAGLTEIGNSAFSRSAISSITIPEGVTAIAPFTFETCAELESVTIAGTVTSIGESAFDSCPNLSSIILPEGLASIGRSAFDACTGLTQVTLPASLASVDYYAFSGSGLTGSITIPAGVTVMKGLVFAGLDIDVYCEAASKPAGWYADWIAGCTGNVYWAGKASGVEIDYSYQEATKSYTVTGAHGEGADAVIPADYDDGAHGRHPVTAIGSEVFADLARVESVSIGANVESIGDAAFARIVTLKTVTIEEGSALASIGENAFVESNITGIALPDTVQSIGPGAFSWCRELKTVNLPEGLSAIESLTFSMSGITGIDIPASVETIGSAAFRGCQNLETVTIAEGSRLASLGAYGTFAGAGIKRIALPDGIEEIPESAFDYCEALEEIKLPAGLASIGKYAFAGTKSLPRFDIPIGVVSVGMGAFDEVGFDIYCAAASKPAGWADNWTGTYFTGTVTWGVRPPLTDEEAVEADAEALVWDVIKGGNDSSGAVTGDLDLVASGANGTSIAWESSQPEYLAADGTVTRPAYTYGDAFVSLAATVTKGEASTTVTFILIIAKADPVEDPEETVISVGAPSGACRAGEQAVVPVHIAKNPGFTAFFFEIAFDDSALSIAELDTAGGVLDGKLGIGGEGSQWYYVSLAAVPGDGLLFNIVFDIAEGAPAGSYDVSIGLQNGDADMFLGLSGEGEEYSIPVVFEAGAIEVADLVTPTAEDLDYDLPKTVVYTGAAQAVAVGKKTEGIGDVTVWYAGTGGTAYEKSQAPPVGVGTYQVTADVAAARATGFAAAEGIALGELTVAKAAAPAIEWPTASAITYGDAIGDSVLTGGTEGYGTFDWADGVDLEAKPEAGSYPVLVAFTPSEEVLANYEAVSPRIKAVTLVVGKAAAPSIEWPTASAITYGQAVGDSILSGGTKGYGMFDWASGVDLEAKPGAGSIQVGVTFAPSEDTLHNYEAIEPLTKAVTVVVNKAPAPAIAWPTASSINEGQPLSASVLTPASNAYGSFGWTDGTLVPVAPGGAYEVTFTPSESTLLNYEPVTPAAKGVEVIVVAQPGDSNGDGKLDARDATMALRAAMGIITLTPAQFAAIDIDKDGVITAADATNVARIVAGLTPKV